MVRVRDTIETLVVSAWREHWDELEWSVKLKEVVAQQQGLDQRRLCDLLIKHATLSEVPNQLLFNYLGYMIDSQMISIESLIDVVVEFRATHRPLCIEAMLIVLEAYARRIRPNANNVPLLCSSLHRLVRWILFLLAQKVSPTRAPRLLRTLGHDSFVRYCLHLGETEESSEGLSALQTEANALLVTLRAKPQEFDERVTTAVQEFITSLDNTFPSTLVPADLGSLNYRHGNQQSSSSSATTDHSTPPFDVSIGGPLLTSCISAAATRHLGDPPEYLVKTLQCVKEMKRLDWPTVVRSLVHTCLGLHVDNSESNDADSCSSYLRIPESTTAAFAFLKVPRILAALLKLNVENPPKKDTVLEVLRELCTQQSTLLQRVDGRAKANAFQCLTTELGEVGILTKEDIESLSSLSSAKPTTDGAATSSDKPQPSPNHQQSSAVYLVLKAAPTFSTLLNSFCGDFAKNPEKLTQMMRHMVTGKSYEYICAAAAATGQLRYFVSKLLEFNIWPAPLPDEEPPDNKHKEEATKLFDLSSILLARIIQLHCASSVPDLPEAESNTVVQLFTGDLLSLASTEHKQDCETLLAKLLGEGESDEPALSMLDDWGKVVRCLPRVTEMLLVRLGSGTTQATELKKFCENLTSCPNVFVAVFAVAQSLSLLADPSDAVVQSEHRPTTEIARQFASVIMQHLQSTDNAQFVTSIVRPLLDPLLRNDPNPLLCAATSNRPTPSTTAKDSLRRLFADALSQRYLRPSTVSTLARVFRCKAGVDLWTRTWLEEFSSCDSISAAADLMTAIVTQLPHLPPPQLPPAYRFVLHALLPTVQHRPMLCIPARGPALAMTAVQCVALVRAVERKESLADETDASSAKKSRVEKTQATEKEMLASFEHAVLTRVGNMTALSAGQQPFTYWVGWLLRYWAEHASQLLAVDVPHTLIRSVISSDARVLPVQHMVSLYRRHADDDPQTTRRRRLHALQDLCLMRNNGAI